jgi:hypothetical protein
MNTEFNKVVKPLTVPVKKPSIVKVLGLVLKSLNTFQK